MWTAPYMICQRTALAWDAVVKETDRLAELDDETERLKGSEQVTGAGFANRAACCFWDESVIRDGLAHGGRRSGPSLPSG